MEFIGTFFLVFSIGSNSFHASVIPSFGVAAPISIGFTLMVLVFIGGYISGAHYNPAVTLGVLLRGGKITPVNAIMFVAVQLFGAFLAAWLVFSILGCGPWFVPAPSSSLKHINSGQALVVEAFWTFVLASAVLHTGTTKEQKGNSFFGLAIGLTVLAGGIAWGDISGACFNPAAATGPAIVLAITHTHPNDLDKLQYLWIYWVGPLLGGAMAAGAFRLIHLSKKHDDRDNVGTLQYENKEQIQWMKNQGFITENT